MLVNDEITEKLISNKERIIEEIRSGKEIKSLKPVIEILPWDSHPDASVTIKDTILFDPVEGENEKFREISSVEMINGKGYRITLRQVILESHDFYLSIGGSLLGVFIALLFLLWYINRRTAIMIWKPFYANLEVLTNFTLENKKPTSFEPSDIQEFEELRQALEWMTKKISDDYARLKEFTENASHEIKTPLSIILAELENAMQYQDIPKDLNTSIHKSYTTVLRLSKINSGLLLLTKIGNRQFDQHVKVDPADFIFPVLKEMQDLFTSKNISVIHEIKRDVKIMADPKLMEILFTNLVNNAFKHNIQSGSIKIILTEDHFAISNTGRTPEGDPEKYFDRFKKGYVSSGSSGLGLSIVKQICKIYNWNISYRFDKNRHIIKLVF
jgi:hypothetical protein